MLSLDYKASAHCNATDRSNRFVQSGSIHHLKAVIAIARLQIMAELAEDGTQCIWLLKDDTQSFSVSISGI
ncbi:hypothetical protein DV736_g6219, partial [Chaetothyriales sp. CBS 134916]